MRQTGKMQHILTYFRDVIKTYSSEDFNKILLNNDSLDSVNLNNISTEGSDVSSL